MSNDIKEFLSSEGEITRKKIADFLESQNQLFSDLPFGDSHRVLSEYLLKGGKMARPTLTRLAYEVVGGDKHGDLVMGSGAVEVFHRFILCHDDIIDQDLTRHNHPTMEAYYLNKLELENPPHPIEMYSPGMAIVDGDVMHSLSLEMVREAKFEADLTLKVLRGFHECILSTAAGWKLETELKQKSIAAVPKEEILAAMRLVSGYYSVLWPLRFGQLFAGVEYGEWNQWMETYGENVGIGFQIQDDILGMFGDEEKTGKPVGNDYREGKKTLLLEYTYNKAGESDREFLEDNLGSTDEKVVGRVQSLMMSLGAVDYAKKQARYFFDKGIKDAPINQPGIDRLVQLAEYLVQREK